ncbi:MAG: imelysin family protein [Bradymonadia bacterium]
MARFISIAAQILVGAALVTLPVLGCDDDTSGNGGEGGSAGGTDGLARQAMLADIGANVIVPTYTEFLEKAQALAEATEALEAAGGDDAAALEAAQLAFNDAMDVWQRAELFSVGPAGADGVRAGGLNLRDEIYSWPTTNPCRVDQELVDNEFAGEGFFEGALINVYGLDAIEYVLFRADTENACPAPVPINSEGGWAALGEAGVKARRAAYAAAASKWLVNRAQTLVDAWSPEGGNFIAAFSNPGTGDSPYADAQDALNELFAAMFYIDKQVKDAKLATPAGLSIDCMAESCPDRLESQWAMRASANIIHNIEGFELLLTGGDGLGFDDLLTEAGAGDLLAQMKGATDGARTTFDGLGVDLMPLMADRIEDVRNAHNDIKALTDLLKSQFVTVLNLSVPQEGASDND